jgi:hypothetical protein
MFFSGQPFEPFNRLYIKPVQVDVKPLVFLADDPRWGHSWTELLALRLAVMVVPSGFDAADFGAPGTYKQPREWLKNPQIFVDLEPLVNHLMR